MRQTLVIFAGFFMLDFSNTRIAFAGKSNKDLERAYWLFRLISSNILVKAGQSLTPLAFKFGLPIKGIIRATIFKQFVGGESIRDCMPVIKELSEKGVGTILDYSVEGKETEESFNETAAELLRAIELASNEASIPFAVFKVTGIGRFSILEKVSQGKSLDENEQIAWKAAKERVNQLCKAAFDKNVSILIDAEESWIQPAIDGLVKEMMERYNRQSAIVFNTVQMYRTDRLEFLKKSLSEARQGNYYSGQKIVRGAYMEKERERAETLGYPSPIQPDKNAADRDYNLALELCMDNLDVVSLCAGTNNEHSSILLTELMTRHKISHSDPRIWFAQLLGMSDHISFNLAAAGYNVAKYVPYGPVKEVLPYLIRRANENTSVAGQTGRELNLISREKQRRKEEKN